MPRGHKSMPRPTSADCVCCQRAMITCNNRRHLIMNALLGGWLHGTPNVIKSCVDWLNNDGIAMADILWPCVLAKSNDGMPRLTYFDCVCCQRAIMACHARRRSPCVLSKGKDDMSCPTSSDDESCPMEIMVCYTQRHLTVCASQRPCWYVIVMPRIFFIRSAHRDLEDVKKY